MPYTSIQKATFERLISPRICMRYTDEVIYVQKNEMEKDFFETTRSSRRATGTSTKVADE